MARISAQIGMWYNDLQTDSQFEVVAVDESGETIEVQLLGGEICEYDFDTWRDMLVVPIEGPEDWGQAYGPSDEDSDPDLPYRPYGQNNPLDSIESNIIYGLDDIA